MTACANLLHPFSNYPPREQLDRDLRYAEQRLARERAGYIGGIAYALRLLGPPLDSNESPINLMAARVVLEAMLDGHADRYVSMAGAEMRSWRAASPQSERDETGAEG
jgi:hypothetical protein